MGNKHSSSLSDLSKVNNGIMEDANGSDRSSPSSPKMVDHHLNFNHLNGRSFQKSKSLKLASTLTTPTKNNFRAANSLDQTIEIERPDKNELEQRFQKILTSLDLPPDKAKVLRNYDDDRKWEMIRKREQMEPKERPQFYLEKLQTYLDPKASRNSKRIRNLGGHTSTHVLRNMEISLRTNNIEWVREFLSEQNRGLDILIEYLQFRLATQKEEQLKEQQLNHSNSNYNNALSPMISNHSNSVGNLHHSSLEMLSTAAASQLVRRPSVLFSRQHSTKVKLGHFGDDVHVCIMCMRAIMNNKFGFNLVMEHKSAINCIALSLSHKSLRTKSLVLELLAAICLVKGGHQSTLNAFDHFKEEMKEKHRFQTLMHYFMNYDQFNIDFMVACMQFINIIVHSVDDMNFRVYLQYEFTQLGLDDYVDNKLRHTESEELQVQIQAYLDNVFDVGGLMADADERNATAEQCQQLYQQLSHAHEVEREWESKFNELRHRIEENESEREEFLMEKQKLENELNHLRHSVSAKEEESRRRESLLESKIIELENKTKSPSGSSSPSDQSSTGIQLVNTGSSPIKPATNTTTLPASPPPPPPPPPPPSFTSTMPSASAPPPPPPPFPTSLFSGSSMSANPPPPPPPLFPMVNGSVGSSNFNMMTLKQQKRSKCKLPTLNWIALKPNQARGTIFTNFCNEKEIEEKINLDEFEVQFQLGNRFLSQKPKQNSSNTQQDTKSNCVDGSNTGTLNASKRYKQTEKVSLLEHNRLRNMAISMRKIDIETATVVKAINTLDTNILTMDYTEVLLRMIPQPEEAKAYNEYEKNNRPIEELSDVDKFLLQISKVERLEPKLRIMFYMNNINLLVEPSNGEKESTVEWTIITQYKKRVQNISDAARALKESTSIRKFLEYILVLGNYMNSSTRTLANSPAYGFKLHALDLITETKSSVDRSKTLLHYLVEVFMKTEFEIMKEEQVDEKVVKNTGVSKPAFPNRFQKRLDEEATFVLETLLKKIEKATEVSLETCLAEVIEIEKGMELCKNELNLRNASGLANNLATKSLANFIQQKGPEVIALKEEMKKAQKQYNECVEYFGENPKMIESSNHIFGTFVRFLKNFKQCQTENAVAHRKKLEEQLKKEIIERQQMLQSVHKSTPENNNMEIKVKEKRLLQQSEVYNGALEDILTGLKNEPFRRADAVRRSQRRKQANMSVANDLQDV